ncbi:MAG: hypothetical protein HQM14_08250 [SAR324 cluster bacterium]|nr:hypothetical protein [SAR324 cluster bacterium]
MTSLKYYFISALSFSLLLGSGSICLLEAVKFFPFSGQRTGWYFNITEGDVVVGLHGPLPNKSSCQQQARLKIAAPLDTCYERETVEFFRWRQNNLNTWVLPIKTGEQSQHLVFTSRQSCHQVAQSGYYFTPSKVKVRLHPDYSYCLVSTVYFDEFEKRYAFANEHSTTTQPYPKRYKAWSMLVDEGHYSKLLQFKYKQHCEQVSKDGKYYNFLPRSLFSKMRVVYLIPKKFRTCSRRVPASNEIPVIYQYIKEHRTTGNSPEKNKVVSTNKQTAWVLTIQKEGGPYPLYFQKRGDCFQVEQQRFYYREINRGNIFPSVPLRTSFQSLAQGCTKMTLPEMVQNKFYPFADKH